jgi:molybdate transport system substrate-binding protein
MKRTITVLLTMTCLTLLLAVSGAGAGEITLSAAASLRDTLTEITDGFAARHPGVTIRKNFGASGALAKQIESGAPVDIFISANQKWVGYLMEEGLLDKGSIAILANNTLVFVGRDTAHVASLADLVKLNRIAIGSPKSVPAGDYAMQALQKAGIDKSLGNKLIMAKDVRECLMYAERGEVDGAFVYRTDALLAKNARILFPVPQELYARISYPMGLTLTGAKNPDARQLLHYLQSAEAKEVLKKYGFTMP